VAWSVVSRSGYLRLLECVRCANELEFCEFVDFVVSQNAFARFFSFPVRVRGTLPLACRQEVMTPCFCN